MLGAAQRGACTKSMDHAGAVAASSLVLRLLRQGCSSRCVAQRLAHAGQVNNPDADPPYRRVFFTDVRSDHCWLRENNT
jgi:hypothetical protein